MMTMSACSMAFASRRSLPGGRVDDSDGVTLDAIEGLEQHPVGGSLDQRDPFEGFLLGALEPFGGAGLRVGVDQGGVPAAGGGDGGQVHGGRRLSDAPFECGNDDDHGVNVASRAAAHHPAAPATPCTPTRPHAPHR
jgi:hypothetical protein